MLHELFELENKSENDQPLIVLDWCMALVKECHSKLEQPAISIAILMLFWCSRKHAEIQLNLQERVFRSP